MDLAAVDLIDVFECGGVALRQVDDVNEIANSRPVRRVIIVSVNVQIRKPTDRHLVT